MPAIIAAVRTSDITINAASKLAALPPEEQRAIAAGGKQAIEDAAKAIVMVA